jgi:hypothetical protein
LQYCKEIADGDNFTGQIAKFLNAGFILKAGPSSLSISCADSNANITYNYQALRNPKFKSIQFNSIQLGHADGPCNSHVDSKDRVVTGGLTGAGL